MALGCGGCSRPENRAVHSNSDSGLRRKEFTKEGSDLNQLKSTASNEHLQQILQASGNGKKHLQASTLDRLRLLGIFGNRIDEQCSEREA